jgi:hypothetical protein
MTDAEKKSADEQKAKDLAAQASSVSTLQQAPADKQTAQKAASEDVFAKNAAKALTQTNPDIADAINQGASNLSDTATIAGSSLPGWGKALVTAIGGYGKGYVEAHAQQEKRAEILAKAAQAKQEAFNKAIEPIISKYKTDTNVQDELTRADAIGQARDLIKNAASYGDKFNDVFKPILLQVIRPEFKRITGTEPTGIGDLQGMIKTLTEHGIMNIGGEGAKALLQGGALASEAAPEYKAILNDFETKNKSNYTRYVEPYKNWFQDAGIGGLTDRYIKPPVWETPNAAAAPAAPAIATPAAGDTKVNSAGQTVKYNGTAWEVMK